jgi:DNA-binding NtrC family response regulator
MRHFLEVAASELRIPPPELPTDLAAALQQYDFPGNVREVANLARSAVAVCGGQELLPADFPGIVPNRPVASGLVRISTDSFFSLHAAFPRFPTLDEVERLLVAEAVRATGGNKSAAADLLGISRPTLHRKLTGQE